MNWKVSALLVLLAPLASGKGVQKPIDADQDGLPDSWERRYFETAEDCVPGADSDGDGITNLQEFLGDSHPLEAKGAHTAASGGGGGGGAGGGSSLFSGAPAFGNSASQMAAPGGGGGGGGGMMMGGTLTARPQAGGYAGGTLSLSSHFTYTSGVSGITISAGNLTLDGGYMALDSGYTGLSLPVATPWSSTGVTFSGIGGNFTVANSSDLVWVGQEGFLTPLNGIATTGLTDSTGTLQITMGNNTGNSAETWLASSEVIGARDSAAAISWASQIPNTPERFGWYGAPLEVNRMRREILSQEQAWMGMGFVNGSSFSAGEAGLVVTAVPEPGVVVLGGVCGVLALMRRRRRC